MSQQSTRRLYLTSVEVRAVVAELDGVSIHANTLAYWAKAGICTPSVRWDRKRGRAHARLYNLTDLAKIRLIAKLRDAGIGMPRVRAILTAVADKLPNALKPKTNYVLIVDGWTATIRRPGRADVDMPSGQSRLPLADVVEGNRDTAKKVVNG